MVNESRREAIELRWQEIEDKLEQDRLTGKCPIAGVDCDFFRGQLLDELDEMENELGSAQPEGVGWQKW